MGGCPVSRERRTENASGFCRPTPQSSVASGCGFQPPTCFWVNFCYFQKACIGKKVVDGAIKKTNKINLSGNIISVNEY